MKQISEERSQVTLTSSGLKIFGVLHLPQVAHTKVPGVLFCHGFGGNKSGKFRLAVRLSELLTQRGIASLRIDFRGCGDSEGDFHAVTFQSLLEDARCAFGYLKSHPAIDATRLGLLGRSLGGAVAAFLASEQEAVSRIMALALWAPLFDARAWFAKKGPTRFFGQTLSDEAVEQFRTLDATPVCQKLEDVPLLLIHAGQDEILGSYHFEKYLSSRKESSPTESYILPNSNHEFGDFEEQQTLLENTASWFSKILYK